MAWLLGTGSAGGRIEAALRQGPFSMLYAIRYLGGARKVPNTFYLRNKTLNIYRIP